MKNETPYRDDMRFRQSHHVAAEAFDVWRTKPARRKCVEQTRRGADRFRRVPSFEAIAFDNRHRVDLRRRHLFSGSVVSVVVAGDRWRPRPESQSNGYAPGIRGEAGAAPEHRHLRKTEIRHERLLRSACRIAIPTRRAFPDA